MSGLVGLVDDAPQNPPWAEPSQAEPSQKDVRPTGRLALWQLNLMRVGHVVMGVGLAVLTWPLLVHHEPWGLAEGTTECC
jgi:hypothetical protein